MLAVFTRTSQVDLGKIYGFFFNEVTGQLFLKWHDICHSFKTNVATEAHLA